MQRALAHRHLRGSLAGGLTFNISHDLHDTGQVLLDAADDLRINVLEVVVLHPLLAQIFFQVIDIEHELQEGMHLVSLLRHHELLKITASQLIQPKEAQVRVDLVERDVVAVEISVLLIKDPCEGLEEVSIADAPVEHLLDEYFLIGVFHLCT